MFGVIALLMMVAATAQASEPSLDVSLERNRIYLGESVRLIVKILDVDDPPDPSLPEMDCDVRELGSAAINNQSMRIINGQVFQEREVGRRFEYALRPRTAGRLEIPPITALIHGQEIVGGPLAVEVVAPDSQDFVILHQAIERDGRYPLQPITVELRVFVKRAPAPYDDRDPASLPNEPLRLAVPWDELPDDLRPKRGVYEWLGAYENHRGAFVINRIVLPSNDPFAIFSGRRESLFDLRGRPATESDVEGLDQLSGRADEYFVYTLRREIEPQRGGRWTFPACTVKGVFATARSARGLSGEQIYALSNSLDLDVDDVPEQGRPDWYSGAVGEKFVIGARVRPDRGRVGDPLTLSVTVDGRGNLEDVGAPDYSEFEPLSSAFRIEKPVAESIAGARVFTYVLRPFDASVTAVPSLPFSYFDLERGRYATLHTEELPIEVDEVEVLSSNDIVIASEGRANGHALTKAFGLFPNSQDPRDVSDERVDLRHAATLLSILPVTYLLIFGLVRSRRKRRDHPSIDRRRRAAKAARQRLGPALQSLTAGERDPAADRLRAVFSGLVADVAGVPEAGLTAREVAGMLAARGVSDDVARGVGALLERCDGLRFGQETDPSAMGDEARALLDRLLRELESGGHLR